MQVGLTITEYGTIFAIIVGLLTIFGGVYTTVVGSRNNDEEEEDAPPVVVMAATERGVNVLDGIVEILRSENERYRNMIEARDQRIEELIDEREELMHEREQTVRARERRIEQLTSALRRERESNGD